MTNITGDMSKEILLDNFSNIMKKNFLFDRTGWCSQGNER